ncbi:MAG: Crp/Fnr family transcriptional regulator [Candidatus Eremiobacteraeota bacterium]|nr:Crp/Fnr family transcriptional regulator [Candidatus Eremiobacteraeota bacterium]
MASVGALVKVYGELGARADGVAHRFKGPLVENKVWYLRQNRLFAEAGDATVEGSEHIFKTTVFPKRSLVFDQGDPTRLVYLIKRGRVRISRLTTDGKEVTVAVLGAGDLFGEETLFESGPRTSVATCLEESLLCTARAEDLFALLSRNPTLALNVAKILSDRLGDASATMEDLAYARVSDRILHVFQRLAQEHGVPVGDGIRIDVRLTHADIASLIGSTRETVSAEMAQLAREGRIRSQEGYVVMPTAEIRS